MARSLLCVRHLTRCFIGVITFNMQNNIASWAPSFLFKGLERLWSSAKVHAAYQWQKWWSKTGLSDSRTWSLSPNLCESASVSQSVMSDFCNPMDHSPPGSSVHGDSPGNTTGVGCHALLHGIFPTQELNPHLLHCRQIPYCLSHTTCVVGSHLHTLPSSSPTPLPNWD